MLDYFRYIPYELLRENSKLTRFRLWVRETFRIYENPRNIANIVARSLPLNERKRLAVMTLDHIIQELQTSDTVYRYSEEWGFTDEANPYTGGFRADHLSDSEQELNITSGRYSTTYEILWALCCKMSILKKRGLLEYQLPERHVW